MQGGAEVGGAVEGEIGGGAHGAGDDDGLGGVVAEIEEEGGFLKGVSAVRDNHTGDFVAGEGGGDLFGETPHEFRRDVGAGELGEVDGFQGGFGGEVRRVGEEILSRESGDDAAAGGIGKHRNGAASEEEDHGGLFVHWTS